jgi:hypothetical protein
VVPQTTKKGSDESAKVKRLKITHKSEFTTKGYVSDHKNKAIRVHFCRNRVNKSSRKKTRVGGKGRQFNESRE